MASSFPVSGSAYVYASAVFGEGVALVTGINLLFDYHIGAALIARNLIHYVINFVKACGAAGSCLSRRFLSVQLPFFRCPSLHLPFFSYSHASYARVSESRQS